MKVITIDGTKYVPETELLKVKKEKVGDSKVFVIGEEVFVRTVTYHYTGRIVDVVDGFVFLEEVAWIACSGRFTEFMKDEKEPEGMESELYGDKIVKINIGSITEVVGRKLITLVK